MPLKHDLAKCELWRNRLRDFQRGNYTIVEFCRRAAVPVWSFYYWRQRLQSGTFTAKPHPERHRTPPAPRTSIARRDERLAPVGQRARPGATKTNLNFLPIQITGQLSVEVHLPNGARVAVPSQDRDAIATVIAALLSGPPERALPTGTQEGRPC